MEFTGYIIYLLELKLIDRIGGCTNALPIPPWLIDIAYHSKHNKTQLYSSLKCLDLIF